jgi:hypothetical protein
MSDPSCDLVAPAWCKPWCRVRLTGPVPDMPEVPWTGVTATVLREPCAYTSDTLPQARAAVLCELDLDAPPLYARMWYCLIERLTPLTDDDDNIALE